MGWRLDEYAKGKGENGRPKASDRNAAPLFNGTPPPV
ncbi:hypothetical protein [Pseudomonas aeruginosa]